MRPRTALLVDDDPATSDSVRALLPWRELKLESAADVDQAVDCLRQRRYCGMVLNLEIGNGRGTEILRHMSREGSGIPIVVITSEFPESLRELPIVDDIKLVMSRPFDLSLLAAMILGLCGLER